MTHSAPSVYDTPAYSCLQAAHYVGLPGATLKWIGGDGLIRTPEPSALSFNNLAEAHILRAMRRKHGLSLGKWCADVSPLSQRYCRERNGSALKIALPEAERLAATQPPPFTASINKRGEVTLRDTFGGALF